MGAVYSQLPDYYIIFFYTVFSVFVVYLTNDPQGVAYTTLQGGIIYWNCRKGVVLYIQNKREGQTKK